MTRKAIIISNPGESGTEGYCEGVKADVSNYRRFLTSPLGGSWNESEIIHLERPKRDDVREQLLSLIAKDYSFVVFCGHGYFSTSRNSTIIELNKSEELNSRELRSNATKRTIILDCCRRIGPEALRKAFMAEASRTAPLLNLSECRKYFDQAIGDCTNGIVVGYACSMNETSGESKSFGGYYSSSIMQSALTWHEKTHIDLTKKYRPFSIVNAHDSATPVVRELSGGTQNPDIEKPRSGPYFPFAIMA